MYGDLPAKNAVYTPYMPKNVWFWPTINITARNRGKGVIATALALPCYSTNKVTQSKAMKRSAKH